MSTKKEYKDFVLEQLSGVGDISCRAMMGEYLLYKGKTLFGGIYDDRLLVKKTAGNLKYGMEEAIPYESAKPMYLVEAVEERELLTEIVLSTYGDLCK